MWSVMEYISMDVPISLGVPMRRSSCFGPYSTVLFRNFAERGHTTVIVNINQAEGSEKRQLYTGYIHFMIFVACSFDAVSAQIYHAGIPQCTDYKYYF